MQEAQEQRNMYASLFFRAIDEMEQRITSHEERTRFAALENCMQLRKLANGLITQCDKDIEAAYTKAQREALLAARNEYFQQEIGKE